MLKQPILMTLKNKIDMKKASDFSEQQRVSIFDDDENRRVYGVVTRVLENSIVIKWEDLHDPVQHFDDELNDIRIEK
jgi:hypothetical protein